MRNFPPSFTSVWSSANVTKNRGRLLLMNERLTTAGEGRTHSFGSCMPPQSEAAVTLPEYVVIQPEPTTRSALVRVGPGSIRHTDCDQLPGCFPGANCGPIP